MEIYMVFYNSELMGAFRTYDSAIGCIAKDQNVSSAEVIKEMEETGNYLDNYYIDATYLED
jgi:hypothetical protein